MKKYSIILLIASMPIMAQNVKITSFRKAKKILPQVYQGKEKTIYCDCKYKKKKVDHGSCGYIPRKNNARANRIEWEHIVRVS